MNQVNTLVSKANELVNIARGIEAEYKVKNQVLSLREQALIKREQQLTDDSPKVKKIFEELPASGASTSWQICKCLEHNIYMKYTDYFSSIENELRRIHATTEETRYKRIIVAALMLKFHYSKDEEECAQRTQEFLTLAEMVPMDAALGGAISLFETRVFRDGRFVRK